MDLALNNLQILICHKTNQPTNLKLYLRKTELFEKELFLCIKNGFCIK